MTESILQTAKKLITGLTAQDTAFDMDLIIHTNSVLNILSQLGAGDPTFQITGPNETWEEFTSEPYLNLCKSYLALKVRLLFDVATLTGPIISAYEKQLQELEWRINAVADPTSDNKLAE